MQLTIIEEKSHAIKEEFVFITLTKLLKPDVSEEDVMSKQTLDQKIKYETFQFCSIIFEEIPTDIAQELIEELNNLDIHI